MIRAGDVLLPRIPFDPLHWQSLQRIMDKLDAPGPPGWGRREDGQLRARCACGLWMSARLHTIDDDGTVSASWYHPAGDAMDCGWHVWIRFLDWDRLGHDGRPTQT